MKKISAKLAISSLIVITAILCFVSVFLIAYKIGNFWQGVPPSVVDDDIYYYGRMMDVAKGYPFLGNPYFAEYKNAMAPAFFLPDWINAAPLLLGLSLVPTLFLNFLLWSIIFAILCYLIARAFNLSPPYSALASLVSFLETYWLVMRPVTMQVVFPTFLLFLLALIYWLKQRESRKSQIFLVLSSALTFYMYTYLWQIVCIILGLLFIYFLIKKNWKTAIQLAYIFIATLIISIPVIIYSYYQITSQYYWQTIARIGLVSTHLPTYYAYQYGRWVIIILAAYLLLSWSKVCNVEGQGGEKAEVGQSPIILTFIFSGLGLAVMSISNLITGKELETALHTGRFITLWVALFFTVLIFKWWQEKTLFKKTFSFKKIITLLLLLLAFGFMLANLNRSLPWNQIDHQDFAQFQAYAAPFNWLNANASSSSVIWADDNLTTYLPTMTKDYSLWNHLGPLHLMPTKEVEDRFLLSWIGTSTSAADLANDYRQYEGAGAVWKYTDEYYKNRLRCDFGMKCLPDQNLAGWIGTDFIAEMQSRQAVLKSNLKSSLAKYSVSYIIADKSLGEDKYFDNIYFFKREWSNDRFVIYKI